MLHQRRMKDISDVSSLFFNPNENSFAMSQDEQETLVAHDVAAYGHLPDDAFDVLTALIQDVEPLQHAQRICASG